MWGNLTAQANILTSVKVGNLWGSRTTKSALLALAIVELLLQSILNKNMADLSIALANRQALADIKRRYDTGHITQQEAKELAQPIINRVNKRAAEVARKYGKSKYIVLDFVSSMRNSYH